MMFRKKVGDTSNNKHDAKADSRPAVHPVNTAPTDQSGAVDDKNVAANMIRQKIQNLQKGRSSQQPNPRSKSTLEPSAHASHTGYPRTTTLTSPPASLQPNAATQPPHAQQPYQHSNHPAQHVTQPHHLQQTLHKSNEKAKHINPHSTQSSSNVPPQSQSASPASNPPEQYSAPTSQAMTPTPVQQPTTQTQSAPAVQPAPQPQQPQFQPANTPQSQQPVSQPNTQPHLDSRFMTAPATKAMINQANHNQQASPAQPQTHPRQVHLTQNTTNPQIRPEPTAQPIPKNQPVGNNAHPSSNKTTHETSSNQPARSSTLRRKEVAEKPKGTFKKSILIALVCGFAYLVVSYNDIAVAQVKQYITPSSSISTPVITDPEAAPKISGESKVIIPKINVDVPVVYDVTTYDEGAIQAGLERGVVHYGTTSLPGENGNNVIVGHSSNNFFNSGQYKFAFVLLDRLEEGDTFSLHFRGERYIYRVFNKEIIEPTDFSLIQQTDKPITTLITCTPPGTSWQRLVIQGEQISPDPNEVSQPQNDPQLPDFEGTVPGNAPSFWSRIF